MLTPVVQDSLNEQIHDELSSSYTYFVMSAHCKFHHYHGFATWLHRQHQEEYGHAMKLYDFLIARNGQLVPKAIAPPKAEFASIQQIFEEALQQEIETSRRIDALYDLASREKAFAALVELQWFIKEQVEEEHTFRDLVTKLKMIKDDPAGLLDLDRELAER